MKQANILVVLVSALSVVSIFLTYTLFAFVRNVRYEAMVKKKDYSQSIHNPPKGAPSSG
jgi:regulatory protein YycH of two-component signal transduction system YycFG